MNTKSKTSGKNLPPVSAGSGVAGYNFPKPPRGYRTDLVLIISPYFDVNWYTRRIIKHLNPTSINFLVDDGAKAEDVEALSKEFPEARIALGSSKGIVHIKGYHLKFVPAKGRGKPEQRFVFGSANATEAGFDGTTNAELIAELDLSNASAEDDLVNYLRKLSEAIEAAAVDGKASSICATKARVAKNQTVHLPAFRIRRPMSIPEFDSWLQRGKLAAKYRDPQHFTKVAVKLKKPLPEESVAAVFKAQDLIPQGSRDLVRYSYLGSQDADIDNEKTPQWKARHCIWTHLGDWLSEECYKQRVKKEASASKAARVRQAKIDELRKNGNDAGWVAARKSEFLEKLRNIRTLLREHNADPSEYLTCLEDGIDEGAYGSRCEEKLKQDFVLASDPEFYQRYVSGHEFVNVPRFRADAVPWDNFVKSWCESVTLEAEKRKTHSQITASVRESIEPDRKKFSTLGPKEICDRLRAGWNSTSRGDVVWAKWDNDYFYPGRIIRNVGDRFRIRFLEDKSEYTSKEIVSIGYLISRYFEEEWKMAG